MNTSSVLSINDMSKDKILFMYLSLRTVHSIHLSVQLKFFNSCHVQIHYISSNVCQHTHHACYENQIGSSLRIPIHQNPPNLMKNKLHITSPSWINHQDPHSPTPCKAAPRNIHRPSSPAAHPQAAKESKPCPTRVPTYSQSGLWLYIRGNAWPIIEPTQPA